jgi:uncharacterized membrane protein
MNLEEMKKELSKLKAPRFSVSPSEGKEHSVKELIRLLRKQDKEDQAYILRRKIIPIAVGIVIFTILLIFNPIRNPVMVTGCVLISGTLLATLALLFIDYMDIAKESFDSSVRDFLRQKEKRLRYWRTTPFKYHLTFFFYVAGVVMIALGNSAVTRNFGTPWISVYLGVIVVLLAVFWIIGHIRYRKRHREKHRPLLELIEELKREPAANP